MTGESKTTTDREVIRRWAETRGGRPAVVSSTHDSEVSDVLRIDFGVGTDRLDFLSWDEFFDIFEKSDLAFLYQEDKADGETSTYFKFITK